MAWCVALAFLRFANSEVGALSLWLAFFSGVLCKIKDLGVEFAVTECVCFGFFVVLFERF